MNNGLQSYDISITWGAITVIAATLGWWGIWTEVGILLFRAFFLFLFIFFIFLTFILLYTLASWSRSAHCLLLNRLLFRLHYLSLNFRFFWLLFFRPFLRTFTSLPFLLFVFTFNSLFLFMMGFFPFFSVFLFFNFFGFFSFMADTRVRWIFVVSFFSVSFLVLLYFIYYFLW